MPSWLKTIFFGDHVFEVPKEVYEPAEDTFLAARHLVVKMGARVLDMGTGCGILAVLAARNASRVIAVDINPHAVECASRNAALNGVPAKVETRLGDLFEVAEAEEEFDLVIFNAPYLPVDAGEGRSWAEKAWSGGRSGRMVVDRFVDQVSQHLGQHGRVLLVQSSLSGVEGTLQRFSRRGFRASVVDEESVFFERLVLIEARSL